ncbi:MAG: O-methyltransferase [Actinomycetes bacterium]
MSSVSPATGATLRWLAELIGARAVAEVGTGAGVSGLWLLRGMAPDGVLTTVDEEAENTRAARQTFTEAGVPTQRVRLITGHPVEVLSRLADGAYDTVFFDANPQESARYFDEGLRLLRSGGLLIFNGALLNGRVADPAQRDAATIAIRTLVNDTRDDERIRPLLLPVGDGVLVAQKL